MSNSGDEDELNNNENKCENEKRKTSQRGKNY